MENTSLPGRTFNLFNMIVINWAGPPLRQQPDRTVPNVLKWIYFSRNSQMTQPPPGCEPQAGLSRTWHIQSIASKTSFNCEQRSIAFLFYPGSVVRVWSQIIIASCQWLSRPWQNSDCSAAWNFRDLYLCNSQCREKPIKPDDPSSRIICSLPGSNLTVLTWRI